MIAGATTALSRKVPSTPARYILRYCLDYLRIGATGRGLDYGCGRGADAEALGFEGYDPHWRPEAPEGKFDVITCSYVLNVVPEDAQTAVLASIRSLLAPGGVAYISVRRDLPPEGKAGRGCYQRNVRLDLPLETENSSYAMYRLEA
jgi:SAM-dependent methyltransferase